MKIDKSYIAPQGPQEKWTGKGDFLGACLCNIFGMAHVWRFPYLIYKNGGGTFLIPYTICCVSLGIPAMLLELTLGQFSSSGPVHCWGFCPLFSGCGVSMATVSFLTGIYYAVLVSWSMLFFIASMTFQEPWQKCGRWSTPNCSETLVFLTKSECFQKNLTVDSNGLCLDRLQITNFTYIWNFRLAKNFGLNKTLPAIEFFDGSILRSRGHTMENLGKLQMPIVLALLLTYILSWLFLIRGIHISAKMLIRTMLLPIVIFIVLVGRSLQLDGSKEGIHAFFNPQNRDVYTFKIWDDAAEHVFFTLTASYGGLIALARYNDFHYNIFRDVLIICVVDTVVSLAVGVMLFSFVGFVSKSKHLYIEDLMSSGPGIAFKIMPMVFSEIPGTSFWCGVFFLMLVFLSLGSQIIYIETVISSLIDWKPEFTRKKFLTISAVCSLMFLLGLPMTTQGGKEIVSLLDTYCTGLNLYIITLCECIAVGWIYGARTFLSDVETMLGRKLCQSIKINKVLHTWFQLNWQLLTPCFILIIIVEYSEKRIHLDIAEHPPWARKLGWTITCILASIILVVAVYRVLIASGSLTERLKTTTSPSAEWAPVVTNQRFLVKKYVEKSPSPKVSHISNESTTVDAQQSIQRIPSGNDDVASDSDSTEEFSVSTTTKRSA